MDGDTQTGRAAVRLHLLDRLDDAGLVKRRGVTQAVHGAMLGRLADHLAYMDPENLLTLAEVLLDNATGGVWPTEVLVRQAAHAIQRPPVTEARILSSWLASVEGPKAEAGGWLVELFRFLRHHRRPPLDWDMRRIREEADANARQMYLVRDRIRREMDQGDDRAWLAQYEADQIEARRVVDAGRQKREERERDAV